MGHARPFLARPQAFAVVLVGLGTVALAAAVVASGTSSSATTTVTATRGVVVQLAASGNVVAALTTGLAKSDDQIVVWKAPHAKSVSIDSGVDSGCAASNYAAAPCANMASAGDMVEQVAVGAGTVAWITAQDGDNQDLSLYRAELNGAHRANVLPLVENGNGAGGDPSGAYIGNLIGSGPLLAYNSWSVCGDFVSSCPNSNALTDQELLTFTSPAPNAAPTSVISGPSALMLSAAGGGRIAIEPTATPGAIDIVSATGTSIATVAPEAGNPPRALALTATALLVERATTLEVDNPTSGALEHTVALGSASPGALVGADGDVAAILDRHLHEIALFAITNGQTAATLTLPAAATAHANPAAAVLDGVGLFYGYDVAGLNRGRIAFVPAAALAAPTA